MGRDRRDHADQDRKDEVVRQSRKRTRDQVSPVVPAKRYRSRSLEREREEYEYSNNRHHGMEAYEERVVRRVRSGSRERDVRRYDSGQSRDSRRDKDVDFRRRGDSRTDSRRSGGSRTDSRRRGGSRTDSRRRAGSRADSRRRAGSRGAEELRRRGGSRTDSRRRCGSRRSNRLQEAAIRDGQRWEKDHEYARRGEQDVDYERSRRRENGDHRHREMSRQQQRENSRQHRESSRQQSNRTHREAKKRSCSRSYRGTAKRSRKESRAPVEDDEEGHLIFSKGDIIQDRYRILRELGEGTFGKVVECDDMAKNKRIAIKIIKNVKKYRDAAKLEINVLKKLAGYDPDCRFKCVQMYDWFDYHGHKCIAFQLLGKSVFDFLKDNNYEPYPIEHVRSVAYELTLSVNFIHEHHLTHTDLKPENVLFYDSSKTKIDKKTRKEILFNPEIRLIDFGSATFDHEHHSSIIQTRHYRAPEVILKLGWDQVCDTWSIGCIIIELALGYMLFDTHNSMEHLAMMERILGPISKDMGLQSGASYFTKSGGLDWDTESKEGRYVRRKVKPLERYIPKEERENRDWLDMFDLIRRMLEYDPKKRIGLPAALKHPFLEKYNLRKPSRSSSGYESR